MRGKSQNQTPSIILIAFAIWVVIWAITGPIKQTYNAPRKQLKSRQSEAKIQREIASLLQRQQQLGMEIYSRQELMAEISHAARLVQQAHNQLNAVSQGGIAYAAPSGITVPILMYHKTPDDFEAQLQHLIQKGYTTISLNRLVGALKAGASLPPKPVILTFDDGFSDQLRAFELLKQYNMKATFYIMPGGGASDWCIGANRQAGKPCGDAYLNWNEIKMLDASGVVTIESHTQDHADLSAQNHEQLNFQLIQSKQEIEAHLGRKLHHLAYPYGSFNNDTIAAVQNAGYLSAVTTRPGTTHSIASLFTLDRVRDAYALP